MSDLHESAHGVSKHVTLGFVLGWIFAAAFAILALVALFQPGQFMTGVFLILAALVALPPAHTFIKKKANVSISGVFRTALAIIFYFLSIAMLASVKMRPVRMRRWPMHRQHPRHLKKSNDHPLETLHIFAFHGRQVRLS
jgi:hypothetical protein